ncbi:MAG: hypothetical protein FWD68_18370 [Alphaproteobacteria bacterium]|nr:hypothetical protein [Alphaproteobacteria bacterium]
MKKVRNFAFALLGVVLVIGLAGVGFYLGGNKGGHGVNTAGVNPQGAAAAGGAAAQPSSSPQPAAGPVQQSVFEKLVQEANIVTCGKTFAALGNGMSRNFDYTAQSRWDSRSANDHSVVSLVALKPIAPGGAIGGGTIFAAPVGGSCEGEVVRVTPVPRSCPDVAAQLEKSNGQSGQLGELAVLSMPGGIEVMLLPFDKACVTVTVLKAAG